MITMLGLFIVVTYVEQRFIVLPNTAGKKKLYGSNPCSFRIGKLITIEIIYNYNEHEWKTTIIMCWKLSITIL